MYVKKIPEQLDYGVNMTMKVLGGKWKPCILDCIHSAIRRPSEIHRHIPEAPRRVINQQLKELEECSVVYKTVYHELPLRVEYHLTERGKLLIPVIRMMDQWGNEHLEQEGVHCSPIDTVAITQEENLS
ncbi:winged helix-turn-helix transcriptional regulator [Chitinophaga nivalis]|uniref:Helix-turn-helix transcriptional regulator n=1 Tax=Chitinophaga nivalis TaxID=2991709 RepID=A0ABT3IMM5_9BACT|nr:helix-turn-helix domain-containing protein [Chitinophaga nivalis]MCW3465092.1 helix-turn-helix transcriptional regulator [Chitinophaga nivalis]MCW3485216.1 helix-turn-helix transcriptional regulator [Chitinophaga nivalis]